MVLCLDHLEHHYNNYNIYLFCVGAQIQWTREEGSKLRITLVSFNLPDITDILITARANQSSVVRSRDTSWPIVGAPGPRAGSVLGHSSPCQDATLSAPLAPRSPSRWSHDPSRCQERRRQTSCVQDRALKEPSRRFHNHREGP